MTRFSDLLLLENDHRDHFTPDQIFGFWMEGGGSDVRARLNPMDSPMVDKMLDDGVMELMQKIASDWRERMSQLNLVVAEYEDGWPDPHTRPQVIAEVISAGEDVRAILGLAVSTPRQKIAMCHVYVVDEYGRSLHYDLEKWMNTMVGEADYAEFIEKLTHETALYVDHLEERGP